MKNVDRQPAKVIYPININGFNINKGYDSKTLISNEIIELNKFSNKECKEVLEKNIHNSFQKAKIRKFSRKAIVRFNRINKSLESKDLPTSFRDGYYVLLDESYRHKKSFTSFEMLMQHCISSRCSILDVEIIDKNASFRFGNVINNYGGLDNETSNI